MQSDVDVLVVGAGPTGLGDLQRRYGAQSECVYLVRPDLYIGFRSQRANGEALDAHLSSILVERVSSGAPL